MCMCMQAATNEVALAAHDAAVVAEILKSKTSVTSVNLSINKEIGDEGAKALAEALKVNATVKELGLYGCGIGDDGAAALAEALRTNSSLSQLSLIGTNIGDEGATALRDAVRGRQGFLARRCLLVHEGDLLALGVGKDRPHWLQLLE